MQNHQKAALDLMHTSAKWSYEDPNLFRVVVADGNYYRKPLPEPDTYLFNESELNLAHPQLFDIALALTNWEKTQRNDGYFQGHLLAMTLEILSKKIVIHLDNDSYLGSIYIFDQSTSDSNFMIAKGFKYSVKDLPVKDTYIKCVIALDFHEHIFKKDELEKQFPGWESRWLIGQGLGISDVELQHYMFSNEQNPSSDLPNIELEV